MKIAVFGDSHSVYFDNDFYAAYGASAEVFVSRGATVTGLGRRTSTLGVHLKVEQTIEDAKHDYYVFKFGQVDIDLGFYYRAVLKEPGLDFSSFLDNVVESYKDYLVGLNLPRNKIIVHLINLPTIRNRTAAIKYTSRVISENASPDQVQVLKKQLAEIMPGIGERTRRTLAFNRRLRSVLSPLGFVMADPTAEFLDTETGILDDAFVLGSQNDHHYADTLRVRKMFVGSLMRVILSMA